MRDTQGVVQEWADLQAFCLLLPSILEQVVHSLHSLAYSKPHQKSRFLEEPKVNGKDTWECNWILLIQECWVGEGQMIRSFSIFCICMLPYAHTEYLTHWGSGCACGVRKVCFIHTFNSCWTFTTCQNKIEWWKREAPFLFWCPLSCHGLSLQWAKIIIQRQKISDWDLDLGFFFFPTPSPTP